MVNSKNSLIKKRNSSIHKKRFSDKVSLTHFNDIFELILSQTYVFPKELRLSNSLNIKTSIYALLKEYKRYKRESLESPLESLNKFALKLQSSGFYLSPVERKKHKSFYSLQLKTLEFYTRCLLAQSKKSEILQNSDRNIANFSRKFSIKNAYDAFNRKAKQRRFILNSELIQNKKQLRVEKTLSALQKRYDRFLGSRLFLFFTSHKKAYKKVLLKSERIRLRLRKLVGYSSKVRYNYVKNKKRYYKEYKKLVWKRKKRKNRKKTGLLRFLRRRRLLFQFYVPRHLEINYKTFEIIHLGSFDLATTNSKIPYYLHLRRLLTFLSL